jgi:S1-C subfamily serine protease
MSKNENNKNERKELLAEIYGQPFSPSNSKNRKATSFVFIFYLIISMVSGFLAGFIQDFWFDNYTQTVINQPASTNQTKSKEVLNLNFLLKEDDQAYSQVLTQLKSQLVGFYKKRSSEDVYSSLYLEKDFLGSGLIVTSDGWLLTPQNIVKDSNFVIVTSDKKVYQPAKKVVDNFSQTAMIKIAAQDLTPVKFADLNTLKSTDSLLVARYALQNHGSDLLKTTIQKFSYHDQAKGRDFLLSTETADHYLKISGDLDTFYNGAILVNNQEEVVGLLFQSSSQAVRLAVPSYYLSSVIKNFLISSAEIMRSYMGVHYLNLSETLGLSDKLTQGLAKGALIVGDKDNKIEAVIEKSPAAEVGLVEGDIILKVNNEDVDEKNSLTKLINDYTPGQELNLVIYRAGKNLPMKLILGEAPKTISTK